MNSEELELSLRSEFESHLETVVAGMRQQVAELQAKVESEFDKHKSQMDAVFQEFTARLESNQQLQGGFADTVGEHLRLARDEGARISALAFEEAERLEAETAAAAAPQAGIAELSQAIADITAQDSQATILRSLVQHAAQFTPRGAFFIIKNEHFVGWRAFGREGDADEQAVREVFFPVASQTALGASVRSLSAVESSFGTYADDSIYLNKLGFGQPDQMYAIPLVARGRGVAVLYADYGTKGAQVNFEALETLVRVAGMTVEVLAAAPTSRPAQEFQPQPAPTSYAPAEKEESRDESAARATAAAEEQYETSSAATDEQSSASAVDDETVEYSAPAEEAGDESAVSASETVETETSQPNQSAATDEVPEVSTAYQPAAEDDSAVESKNEYHFESNQAQTETGFETEKTSEFGTGTFEPVEPPTVETAYSNGRVESSEAATFEPAASEPAPAATTGAPTRSRFNDRNVDLPIEVGEDERRLHNDARRFARLLVSEIKLYNEQKVKEGREAQDLYERLREAIDRSRDMYDKRVQPPVAAKFDYFHYELVSSLAEGEENRLGGGYPGATI